MKRIWIIAPILFTLLLLCLGAWMPRLTSLVLDHRLEKETTHRKDADFSLELSQNLDFFRILELFHSQQSQIKLTDGYRMTATDAASKAEKILESFGMIYSPPQVTPILITNQDTLNLSGVFWRCTWGTDASIQEILWLDDQSGQMAAYHGRIRESTLSNSTSYDFASEFPSVIADFYRAYDAIDDVTIQSRNFGTQSISVDSLKYDLTLIRYHDSLAETYTLPLRVSGSVIDINMPF